MATLFGTGATRGAIRPAERAGGKRGRSRQEPKHGLPVQAGLASATSLTALVEEQIIPRLLVAHSSAMQRVPALARRAITSEDAARFVSLPLELDADELLTVVEGFIRDGAGVESVYVDLLAPSARRLGQHWERDECDFLDVTMGLWRLQEVMRQLAIRYPPPTVPHRDNRSALFAPLPGDGHVLGALMVEEVFARAGWQTEVLIESSRRELLHLVAERRFDLVGLTVSCDSPNDALSDLISAIRGASKVREVRIIIGGRMVNANPEVVGQVGADGSAIDARSALAVADGLVKVVGHVVSPSV